MQSNSPVPNFNYSVANGGNSSTPFITILSTVDPTSSSIQYQVKQRWINTVESREWILTGFTSNAGVTTANWLQISDGDAIVQFTGGTGTTGFPVNPNSDGQVQLTSSDSSVIITGSTNSIDFRTTAESSFNQIVIQTFTTTDAYAPTLGMAYCIVECVGAGGGGGGVTLAASGQIAIGGGGGSGAYGKGVFSSIDIGVGQLVTIGAGGTGGANTGGTGGTGGSTIFGTSPLITCTGGTGGIGSGASAFNSTNGGNGGTSSGSGLSFGTSGTGGGVGIGINLDPSGSGFILTSGYGGNSMLGAGGRPLSAGESGPGNVGTNGGGGSGALSNANAANLGGVGGNGLVIITEYISS
jgi:hypothetical protein